MGINPPIEDDRPKDLNREGSCIFSEQKAGFFSVACVSWSMAMKTLYTKGIKDLCPSTRGSMIW